MSVVIRKQNRFERRAICKAISANLSRTALPLDHRSVTKQIVAVGLMSLALAACSGGDGDHVLTTPSTDTGTTNGGNPGGSEPAPGDGTGGTTDSATVLDCVRDKFPCSFDEVPLPVIEQSLSLSAEAAKQLQAGVTIEQVAAFLSSQSDIADVIVDGPVIGFRLQGGRPMIVDMSGDQDMLAVPQPAAMAGKIGTEAAQKPAGERKPTTFRTAIGSKITGDNRAQRHALVLSPFRYEPNFGNSGEAIATELNGIRGYTGNVTYLATTNESDPQVTVDVLTQLDKYDVIHMDTHGGTLCKKGDGTASNADKEKCADGTTDFLVQRFHGTAQDLQSIKHPGVVHYTGRRFQSIAVTADFFRHYYPQGLKDKLFILGSCNTFRADMANAIAGNSGVFVSWDGYADRTLVRNAGLSLLDSLGLGLTVGEAYDRVPTFTPENPEAQGKLQRTTRKAGGDLRIRDLMTIRDNITGELISDSSGIEVMETPEDDVNDNLDLDFTIDGITPEQLENFIVNLVVDNQTVGQLNVKDSGVQVDDFSYRVTTPVALPFDVEEGQPLHMDFWIPLPDEGDDRFIAAPRVNYREEPKVGKEWVLSSKSTESHHDSSTVMTAAVEFEIEADDDPGTTYHYFRVKSGSLRVQRDYEDALNCRYHIDHTIQIAPGADNNYLRFDVNGPNLFVSGFGRVQDTIQVIGVPCGEVATVKVGGVYFTAEDVQIGENSGQGMDNNGAATPTIIEWTLDKTL